MLLSNWEDQIVYGPTKAQDKPDIPVDDSIQQFELAAPLNEALESGLWTQSIIWGPHAPFRDFTQIVEPEEESVSEEKPAGASSGKSPLSRGS